MSNIRQYFFYAVYGVTATVIFLYLLFPSDTLREYLVYHLNKAIPELSMTIDRIKPVFPPGIKLNTVDLYRSGQFILDVSQITIKPKLLSFFTAKQGTDFKGNLYGGIIEGSAMVSENNRGDQMEINADFSGIQVNQIPFLENALERKISGRLEGKMLYKGNGLAGAANGRIKLTDSEIELPAPVLSLKSVSFENVEADLVLQNRILQVKNCALTGKQVTGSFSGTIRLNTPFKESGINLSGTFKPQPSFISALTQNVPAALLPRSVLSENGFTIRLRGTFADPGYTIR